MRLACDATGPLSPRRFPPSDYLTPATTRVLLAMVRRHERGERCTYRTLAADLDLAFSSVAHHVGRLRDAGLVEVGLGQTRPLVRVVAHG